MIWGFMIMQWEKEIRTKGRKEERKKKKKVRKKESSLSHPYNIA
jgi:hypothetical protein